MEIELSLRVTALARNVLLAAVLAGTALSAVAPVQAASAQFFGGGSHHDDDECQTYKQAVKSLRRMKFFNINPLGGATPPEGQFAFGASKKMRNGEVHPFHIYYDACERVIISASDEQ